MALTITRRELIEIAHSIYYARTYNHGTVGHNQLILTAKLAEELGFRIPSDGNWEETRFPEGTVITDKGV